jgi:ribosomal protein L16 Arg81 hydroxylase
VQIAGSKTWRIFEPAIALPLESQALDGASVAAAPRIAGRVVTLAPGDTLYLPRGYGHEAIATDERTLHVTFALAPVRVIDLLRITLELEAEANVALRRSLPIGWQHDPAFATSFAEALAANVAEHFTAAAIERGAQAALHEQFAASRAGADGLFDRSAATRALNADALLSIDASDAFLLRDRAGPSELLLPGTVLALPDGCAAAFEQLLAGPVRFGDLVLPLPETDRALFIAALIRAGIVRVEHH